VKRAQVGKLAPTGAAFEGGVQGRLYTTIIGGQQTDRQAQSKRQNHNGFVFFSYICKK
jgi:hypothetical protein